MEYFVLVVWLGWGSSPGGPPVKVAVYEGQAACAQAASTFAGKLTTVCVPMKGRMDVITGGLPQ